MEREQKNENVRNRPRIELALRKDVSLTGEPLCPKCRQPNPPGTKFCGACGYKMDAPPPPVSPSSALPPQVVVTRERHNRGRGTFTDFILRIVIILALLAGATLVVLFVQDHYQDAEGRPTTFTPTNAPTFAAACQNMAREVLAPSDATTPVQASDIATLRQRAAAAGREPENAQMARLVGDFSDRMDNAFRKREEARQEAARAGSAPAATLSPDPAEQQRVREFMQRSARRRWDDFVAAQRDPLNQLLASIEREEKRLAAPRVIEYATPWKKLTRWVGGLFSRSDARPGAALSAPPPPSQDKICPACLGQGRAKCTACGGFGSVPAKEEKPCGQCGGTGLYQSKMSHTTIKCPFCQGKGKTTVDTRQPCSACGNLGYAPCARCAGTGRLAAAK